MVKLLRIERDADGGYTFTDEHGQIRARFEGADQMAVHYAFMLQSRPVSPVIDIDAYEVVDAQEYPR